VSASAIPVPPKLGKYAIRRELGRGAMGVVYEGFDPVIERVVAIKTIRPEHLDEGADDMMARFRREAQAAGRLNHPNIVSIYEYGEENGVAFIAMEFVKGKELKSYFDEGRRFADKDVARLMGEILGALEHAHRTGVTHRDMKPANVIILEGGVVKVADFGLARIETSDLTQAGTIMGTPTYMSPEQFLGTPADGRSDIFSCGVMLYQFLTGERPFTGAATTIMRKVLGEEPMAPSQLNTLLAPGWDAVVKRAMAKKPGERYQTAAAFAADILAVAEGRAPSAAAADPDATVLAPSAEATVLGDTALRSAMQTKPKAAVAEATLPPTAALPAEKPPAKKSNAPLLMAAAAVLVAAIGGGAYVLGSKRTEVPAPAASQTAPPATPPAAAAAVAATPAEAGFMTISAVGFADPAKFNGDAAAAGSEARADAKRQLIEKALALYVSSDSLNSNYQWVRDKFLPRSGEFIKTTFSEDAPQLGKDGLVATTTRASISVRDVQKSLNQMSEKERIQFIRNNGDPKISVQVLINNADTAQALPAARSQLAENVIKERIKSFGFRTWSMEGETRTGPDAKAADFHIVGEVKVKQLSATLAASGLTITKTALTSWTVKAIDKSTGEEIYNSTKLPKSTSWPTEDAALVDIGRQVGDEFSKNFFLEHFNFGSQKINLVITGLPDAAASKAVLRELGSLRVVLDAQPAGDNAYQVELPEGSASDLIAEGVLKPLNAKLGQACFVLGAVSGKTVGVTFGAACAQEAVRGKMESAPPAGLLSAPSARSKSLLSA
jgi:tRNA A-37 threonylcarbamoyl transferase component Bud32